MTNRNAAKFIFILAGLLLLSWGQSSRVPRAAVQDTRFKVVFFDIGQGDAILLTTPHGQRVLIDGGPDSTILTRLGAELPFNVHRLNLVIASHNHADHITGLNAVLSRYDVDRIWISGAIHTTNEYLNLLGQIKAKKIPTDVVWQGTTADIDGVHLEVDYPLENMEGKRPADQHDATVVVRATYGSRRFLFTGDLNETHEQAMVDAGVPLAADVLKVPHHGSSTGLLPSFLVGVAPRYAVIQVGKDNSYGHPGATILQRLKEYEVTVFRNDTNGTIRATTNGEDLTVVPDRLE